MKNLRLIFALALFWGLSGLLVGLGIRAFLDGEWMIQCMALNIIAGMLMLLFITRDEGARKAFYEGVAGDNPRLGLALLWALPFSLLGLDLVAAGALFEVRVGRQSTHLGLTCPNRSAGKTSLKAGHDAKWAPPENKEVDWLDSLHQYK